MDLGMRGKQVVVSAASKGIGRAIAEQLAAEGADLYLCSRDGVAMENLARELSTLHGVRARGYAVDVSSKEELEEWIGTIQRETGRIDALVCNAGGPPGGSFMDLDDEVWLQAIQTNLMSVIRMLRGFHPLMKAAGGARVITVASSSVKIPIPGLILSNTLRTGLAGLMKTLASEWAEDGILLNTVCPGRIMTGRLDELDTARAQREGTSVEALREQLVKDIPLGRYGTPQEFAEFSTYLLSPRNTYMTGSTFYVDGGMVKSL